MSSKTIATVKAPETAPARDAAAELEALAAQREPLAAELQQLRNAMSSTVEHAPTLTATEHRQARRRVVVLQDALDDLDDQIDEVQARERTAKAAALAALTAEYHATIATKVAALDQALAAVVVVNAEVGELAHRYHQASNLYVDTPCLPDFMPSSALHTSRYDVWRLAMVTAGYLES